MVFEIDVDVAGNADWLQSMRVVPDDPEYLNGRGPGNGGGANAQDSVQGRLIKSYNAVFRSSDCGANAEGGGGFQPGNTCGKNGESGTKDRKGAKRAVAAYEKSMRDRERSVASSIRPLSPGDVKLSEFVRDAVLADASGRSAEFAREMSKRYAGLLSGSSFKKEEFLAKASLWAWIAENPQDKPPESMRIGGKFDDMKSFDDLVELKRSDAIIEMSSGSGDIEDWEQLEYVAQKTIRDRWFEVQLEDDDTMDVISGYADRAADKAGTDPDEFLDDERWVRRALLKLWSNVDTEDRMSFAKDEGLIGGSGSLGEELMGLGITDPASFVGAHDDATVNIVRDFQGNIEINAGGDGVEMLRTVYESNGEKVVLASSFVIDNDSPYKGKGTDIFAQMVRQAREAGFDKIKTNAAAGGDYNGHYTWALIGYDQSVIGLEAGVYAAVRDAFPDADSVQDIISAPGGRDWWFVNGGSMMQAEFDLSDDSRSMRRLRDYLAERSVR